MVAAASLARLVVLCAALWAGCVAAQQLPAAASPGMKASGLLQLGRVAFALPPGEWQVLPMPDMEIRKTLAGMALAALIEADPIASSPDNQIALATRSGEILLAANQSLLETQARIGTAQEAIEKAKVEAQSERSAMDLALSELMSVDLYERATQLEQVESQIELLYALTVRSSNLKLTNYL